VVICGKNHYPYVVLHKKTVNAMEELLELRQCIEEQRYDDALHMIDELEEMSREDKINKIYSYAEILLLHLIKQAAEKHTTRSWELSIWNAARHIARTNKRRKDGGTYVLHDELRNILTESYPAALKRAALEAFEGLYDEQGLEKMIDKDTLLQQALQLINDHQQGNA
jgi:uncharacterized circularly permuted ATP-grasp superfamily protein